MYLSQKGNADQNYTEIPPHQSQTMTKAVEVWISGATVEIGMEVSQKKP
jgi:hypothetical protein